MSNFDLLDGYFAGDSAQFDYDVLQSNGTPYDLTGATYKWAATRAVGATPVLEKTLGSGVTLISAVNGKVKVNITKGQMPAGTFTHQLEVNLSNGESFTTGDGIIVAARAVYPGV